ncbi:MAG: glutathione S-transferase N-terminal domain-containing protein [Kofleriaceae bacterium]
MPARLITIPFSHYCEKARWALDRAGLPYAEEGHPPGFSGVAARRAGGTRSVPVLVPEAGRVIADSTDILRWCDAMGSAPSPLFPSGNADAVTLEERFDVGVGLGRAPRRVRAAHRS